MLFPEDQQLFTINELAKVCGVSRTTLIRIEECGILTPCYVNPDTGYRYYNAYNASQIGQYLFLQSMGLTREETAALYYRKANAKTILKAQWEKLNRMQRVLEEFEVRSKEVHSISFSYLDFPEQTCYSMESELSSAEEGEVFFFKTHEQCMKDGFQLLGTELLFGLRSDDFRFEELSTQQKVTACIPVVAPKQNNSRLITFPAIHAFTGIAYGDYGVIGKLCRSFWQEINVRRIQPAGPARLYGLVAPYTGNHYSSEGYCYRIIVPVNP